MVVGGVRAVLPDLMNSERGQVRIPQFRTDRRRKLGIKFLGYIEKKKKIGSGKYFSFFVCVCVMAGSHYFSFTSCFLRRASHENEWN